MLDGQQRLQSLYLALYGTLEGKRLYFDILSGKESDETYRNQNIFSTLEPMKKLINGTIIREHKQTYQKEKESMIIHQSGM